MVDIGMNRAEIRRDVLELCSEDIHGSWELWWGKEKKLLGVDETLKRDFVDVIDELVQEGLLKVFHMGRGRNRTLFVLL